jgi:hypothetical protein
MRSFHVDSRAGKKSVAPDGSKLAARSFGVKFGYWPCFRAPFIEIAIDKRRYAAWYGYSGYAEAEAAGAVAPGCRVGECEI